MVGTDHSTKKIAQLVGVLAGVLARPGLLISTAARQHFRRSGGAGVIRFEVDFLAGSKPSDDVCSSWMGFLSTIGDAVSDSARSMQTNWSVTESEWEWARPSFF